MFINAVYLSVTDHLTSFLYIYAALQQTQSKIQSASFSSKFSGTNCSEVSEIYKGTLKYRTQLPTFWETAKNKACKYLFVCFHVDFKMSFFDFIPQKAWFRSSNRCRCATQTHNLVETSERFSVHLSVPSRLSVDMIEESKQSKQHAIGMTQGWNLHYRQHTQAVEFSVCSLEMHRYIRSLLVDFSRYWLIVSNQGWYIGKCNEFRKW